MYMIDQMDNIGEREKVKAECSVHQIKKDFLLCFENNCNDRLGCIECYTKFNHHRNHKSIFIKDYIKSEQSELGRIFNSVLFQMLNTLY